MLGPCCLSVHDLFRFLHLRTPHSGPTLLQVLDYWRKSRTDTKKHHPQNFLRRKKQGKFRKIPNFCIFFSYFFFLVCNRSRATLTWQNLPNYEHFQLGQVNFLSCCPWDMGSVSWAKWWSNRFRIFLKNRSSMELC